MREMKDSGIEWVGKIPKNWDSTKLKYIFTISSGSTPSSTKNDYWDGKIKWITPADFKTQDVYIFSGKRNITLSGVKSCNIKIIPSNSIIFSKRAPIGSVVINTCEMTCNQGCFSLVSNKNNPNIKFYYYSLSILSDVFNMLGTGTTFKEISASKFANTKLQNPTSKTQQQIADFLDSKCSEIDAIAKDIQKEITVLEDYKKSVITEAVTKGLNPNVEMKDSGVAWIGKIPKHWNIVRGKYVLTYLQKPTKESDGVITCFRDGEVTLRSNRREDGFTISEKEIGYQGVDVGDLVVHGMDGFAGAIGISDSRGKASPVLNVLDSKLNKRYLMYYLRSMAFSNVFVALASGIRVRSCDLRWNKLADLPYPVAELNEQTEIVHYIDDKCNEINTIISEKQKQIEVLADYKKSLIYEYVTGKKEVPSHE